MSFLVIGPLSWFSREEKLVECAKALKVNVGTDPNADLGPVTTKEVSVQKNLLLGYEIYGLCTCRRLFFCL